MADRLQFKEKLAGVLALAEDQNGKITVDEVEKYFEEDGLSQEQMNLVCDYLLSMKMAVIGYKQAGGTVKEAENEEQQPLSPDEQKYVEEYLRSLGDMNEETPEEVRMAYYLPKVVEEAVRLHHPEVFIGDMIQEGNIVLMLALKEIRKEKDEEEILEQIRAGMLASLESQTEVKRRESIKTSINFPTVINVVTLHFFSFAAISLSMMLSLFAYGVSSKK